MSTSPETNITPENGWLEYYFPIGKAYFQGRTISFREDRLPEKFRKINPKGLPVCRLITDNASDVELTTLEVVEVQRHYFLIKIFWAELLNL